MLTCYRSPGRRRVVKDSSLVSSRNHNLTFGPIDDGPGLHAFDANTGSEFLFHLLRMDVVKDAGIHDSNPAHELAKQLDGHVQAVSHMGGLIQKRPWFIHQFREIY